MLAMIIYIGLFVWGMNSDKLSWRHAAVIFAVFLAQSGLFYAMAGGEMVRTGTMSLVGFLTVIGIEGLIDVAVFFVGYGVNRFRQRRQAPDDAADTFS